MNKLTVNQLKDMLRKNGKRVSGTKSQLIERLNGVQIEPTPLQHPLRQGTDESHAVFTEEEHRAKSLLERNGMVGNCGKLRTREQFDDAIKQMGGINMVFEIFST